MDDRPIVSRIYWMHTQHRVPPAWVLTLPILSFGLMSGFAYVTLPQMLAARGISGGKIAAAVAVISTPAFWSFLLAPLLDLRLRRRTYALIFGLLSSIAVAFTIGHRLSLGGVEALMLIAFLCGVLQSAAVGGWIGSLIKKEQDGSLGAWTTIFNIGGLGTGALLSGYATLHWSAAVAAALVFIAMLAPMLVFPLIPAPPPDAALADERLGRFVRDVLSLFKHREVRIALLLFALPCGSFALTNVLSGWGSAFHASATFVSVLGGSGSIVAGIIGCSLAPLLARKLPLRPLYLSIGLIGATFTLALLLLPHVPWAYGIAYIGENVLQSAAIATAYAIVYEIIGAGNPLAATVFALLSATAALPIDYMAAIDGGGYAWRGISGAFLTDAVLTGTVCLVLFVLLRRRLRPSRPAAEPV